MARARQILFRIFYSTSFTLVFLLLLCFICAAPADAIYESYKRNRLTDIFIIAGTYVITAIIAIFLYSSRLYTNRSVLRDIPKTFMPVEKEDLPVKRVKRLIDECLARSAVVAYHAKPRSKRIEDEVPHAGPRILEMARSRDDRHLEPRWGTVSHPGWASPESQELPNLEYSTVVNELVDLIEAKAVSLAPVDPLAPASADGQPVPDHRVVELLTRPDAAGMRQYLTWLIKVGLLPDNELSTTFLAAYERARFGAEPLSDTEFKVLMRMFAELLRSMDQNDTDLLRLADVEEEQEVAGQILEDGRSNLSSSSSSGKSTFSNNGSVRHRVVDRQLPPRRVSEDSAPSMMSEDEIEAPSLRTAPVARSVSRPSLRPTRSAVSVRSSRSSKSNGSVIRLATPADGHDMPYTIQLPNMGTN